jgi:protein TIF31
MLSPLYVCIAASKACVSFICNFFSFRVICIIILQATDAYNFYTTGQTKIQQGYLKEGYELISEALNLLNNVYGAMHPEIAQCLRMLARLNYIMGEHAEAMAYQQKAVLMSERVNGIDHPYTITEYVSNN